MTPTGFYAYSSESSHLADTIETAIKAINNRNEVRLGSWRRINLGGHVVIKTILNRIKLADIFVGDITGLNPNVLFELGFAIGLRKRVWLTLDITKANSVAQIKSLEVLSEIGYRSHVNHDDIITQFLKDRPHLDLQGHVLKDHDSLISGILKSPTSNDVFYIPSSVEGSAVKRIVGYLSSLREHNERRVVVYDELENNTERLRWYLRNILEANATIAHLDDVDSANAQINNARCSLLAGIALGFERHVLMIAPTPFDPPFDYRDLLYEYKNARQCKQAVERWLRPIFLTRVERRPLRLDSELALLEFHIGEPSAENEEVELRNYFVPTPAYSAGTRNKMGIFDSVVRWHEISTERIPDQDDDPGSFAFVRGIGEDPFGPIPGVFHWHRTRRTREVRLH